MLVYVVLVVIYIVRVMKARVELSKKLKTFIYGMGVVTVMIFIRCIYRTVELQAGWNGYIITHEVYFACLDGLPMIIALVAFNIFHPGWYVKNQNNTNAVGFGSDGKEIKRDFPLHESQMNSVPDTKA